MAHFLAGMAILASGIYVGGAWYVMFVELPAQNTARPEIARVQWAESVKRTPRYAAFALVATAAALVVGRASPASLWTWGALCIFCVLPYTAFVILPLQRKLLSGKDAAEWPASIQQWGRLHAARLMLGFIALILFLDQGLTKPF